MKTTVLNQINEIVTTARQHGLGQIVTEDKYYDGKNITVDNKNLLNFGSCSYLGLETDQRLKVSAIDAIMKYGIQFSSSRHFVSCSLYDEYEILLQQIFGAHIAYTTSVSLGHHGVIPIIVRENDAIILDQQVHASVQDAAFKMKAYGIKIVVIPHNDMAFLKKTIEELEGSCNNIWYMIDGVYSMYGDYPPVDTIKEYLDSYDSFHLYADDAHGMGWAGKHGRGFLLSQMDLHPKMVMATSLNKAFGAGGGLFIFPDKETKDMVRNCGGPFMFSGPHQIPVIAAGIASAKIHLSSEIYDRQEELKSKIAHCQSMLEKYNLPIVSNPTSPIFFIGAGKMEVGYKLVKKIIDAGFYVNISVFPTVPKQCTGLRFTITTHHSYEDIENLAKVIAQSLPEALSEEGSSLAEVCQAFDKVPTFIINKEKMLIG
ncbi:aminotransferase class I/II-fold pyridoxal phosphate-dependent enzyme [Cytophagaceae bacterium ABcell3]|nr:aminotransferase class I/II-fold pyridoxal phosphate-dependent enzyme [Cytophagaceae bacterium ABcell3]